MREFGQKTALGRTAFTHGVTWRWRREEEGSVLRERRVEDGAGLVHVNFS